ncbi:MAG: hypothetical protein ABJA86_11860 [Nocardioidaceae bacterium]
MPSAFTPTEITSEWTPIAGMEIEVGSDRARVTGDGVRADAGDVEDLVVDLGVLGGVAEVLPYDDADACGADSCPLIATKVRMRPAAATARDARNSTPRRPTLRLIAR